MLNFDMFDRRAVFIDRDGTVIKSIKREWPKNALTAPWFLQELEFMPKVQAGLKRLQRLGFLRILVTNQPDVSYGYTTKERWQEIQNTIVKKLRFDDVFMCRHSKNCNCLVRKPSPMMLTVAACKWGINLNRSYMIGDTDKDIGAGWGAGCKTILIDTEKNQSLRADYHVPGFWEAAKLIEQLEM